VLGNHLSGIDKLDRNDIELILNTAEDMRVIVKYGGSRLLSDKLMVTLFYEPSTRTRLSFEAAMLRLGGQVTSVADAVRTSSVWKGETLADTIRTIDNYADVIVMRHSQAGAAEEAAHHSRVPILNAGDGTNEHPTQALLDLFTMRDDFGTLDGLSIILCGDLKHTRSTNSIALGLAHYQVHMKLVSPPELRLTERIKQAIREKGQATFEEYDDICEAIQGSDILYVTRIQKERLENPDDYAHLKGSYIVNRAILEMSDKVVRVLHHLPRVGELSEDVDDYPGARYFVEPFNGVLVRMALLVHYLGRS
jgi:aspartate carbamoyltransferase catalytic subunit